MHASHSTNAACNKLKWGEDAPCRKHACMQEGSSELDKLKVSLRMHKRQLFSGKDEPADAGPSAVVPYTPPANADSDEGAQGCSLM